MSGRTLYGEFVAHVVIVLDFRVEKRETGTGLILVFGPLWEESEREREAEGEGAGIGKVTVVLS